MDELVPALFIGGPIDGTVRAMEPAREDELMWKPGEPPIMIEVAQLVRTPDGAYEASRVQYLRRVETRLNAEHGSVWEYLYVPPKGSAS